MSLITRILPPDNKNAKLTFADMDNNLYYLQSLGVSAITFSSSTLTLTNPTGGTKTVTINDYYTTGATYSNGLIYFNRNDQLSAYTVNISSLTGDANTFITAVTYTSSANTITLTDNTNNNFNVYINSFSGLTVNGSLSATTLYGDGSNLTGISTQDTFVTGGTYSASTLTFTNNTGGTFNVSGITTSTNISRTLFVDPNGNDSTAVKGDIFKPYANLYAAKSAATSGDTIYVLPGTWTYDNRTSNGNPYNGQMETLVNLWKNNVNYYFSPGTKVIFYNQTITGENMTLFKPQPTQSGDTVNVYGSLEFETYSVGADTSNGRAIFFGIISPQTINPLPFTFYCQVKSLKSYHSELILLENSTIFNTFNFDCDYMYHGYVQGQSGSGSSIISINNSLGTDNIRINIKTVEVPNTILARPFVIRNNNSGSTYEFNVNYITSRQWLLYARQTGQNSKITYNVNRGFFGEGIFLSEVSNNSLVNISGNFYADSSVESSVISTNVTGNGVLNLNGNIYLNNTSGAGKTLINLGSNQVVNVNANVQYTGTTTTSTMINASNGTINFTGKVNGPFGGRLVTNLNGRVNITNSYINPTVTGTTMFNNTTTATQGTISLLNSSIFLTGNTESIDGKYLKINILNSQIKNSGTGDIYVNTTSAGSMQLHNTTLVSVSGKTINVSGAAPLTTSNTTSNTPISATTINGSLTVLTELDIL
jgi:hypothetical protein